ncbi:MAG: hypothetical protein KDN19_18690 [Verrucomicrobiae bacterium]|nr:hypothetical protein [Verrucomicrobiae bacterium]
MNDDPPNQLPPELTEKLAEFRRRVRVIKFAEGLLAALFGLALSWLFVFILDRFGETPRWLRTTLLLAGTAVAGIGLPLLWHRWVWRQRRLEDVARLVRRAFPRLGDQLLGIVELAHEESLGETGRSERLVRAAIAQAADAVKDKDLSGAVPNPHHRGWAVAAGALLVLAIVAGIVVPEAARNAAVRWLMPWRDTERYTFAQVDALPKKLVVPYAEPFEMPASLKEDTKWTPEKGKARIPGQPKLEVDGEKGRYPFAFPPQKDDTEIALAVGDDREKVKLEPRTRPELTRLVAKVRLPEYLKYDRDLDVEVRGGTVRLLDGAAVSWIAEANRELKSGSIDGRAAIIAKGQMLTEYQPVTDSVDHTFAWKDVLGLEPREPLKLRVQAVKDEAPSISARRETQEQVVLDSEVVAFDLAVQDDFGIRQVGLEWKPVGGGEAAEAQVGGKIAAAGAPDMHSIETRATFSATREGLKPQTLEVRAWAEDYLDERGRVYSPAFVLHVLDSTDHALWLTEQFGKWLDAARESYEREQQLHAINQELRAMEATDLDRPENRRRVARQAADEQANAARLDSLNDSGRRLVEQGTRNPEFDAERLESWATMLQMLDDIAEKRMPSVADLLKESSSAAGAKPGQAPDPNSKPSNNQGQQTAEAKPSEAKENSSGPSKPTAPSVKNGELAAAPGPPKPVDPEAKQPDPVPTISDNEKGYLKTAEAKPQPPGPPKKPSAGFQGLPNTTLGALPGETPPPKPPQSDAQEKLDQAVNQQRDLLAEFAKVADDLSELLASLEASTFVKRLKAASRAQMEIAKSLNVGSLSAFGIDAGEVSGEPANVNAENATHSRSESEKISDIQSDLAAYVTRKPDMRFTSLLDAMKDTQVIREIADVAATTESNFSGSSIIQAEFWADTLDRWAENLVSAAQCSSCSGGSKDSLPPEIVLKVMQALHDEMDLRDETRELEKSRSALKKEDFADMATGLSKTQYGVADHVRSAVDDIINLEGGPQKFSKEIQLLSAVITAMLEARDILQSPDTGPPAIAAETEAIELLLQARRQKPGGGGGGGSNPGGGSGSAVARSAALSEIGPGADAEAEVTNRSVGQSTGRAGQEFPEEFRAGLDAYFNALEKEGGIAQ